MSAGVAMAFDGQDVWDRGEVVETAGRARVHPVCLVSFVG